MQSAFLSGIRKDPRMDPGFGSEIRNRVPGLRLWFRFLWHTKPGFSPVYSPQLIYDCDGSGGSNQRV